MVRPRSGRVMGEPAPTPAGPLAAPTRWLHRALLEALLTTGDIPASDVLATAAGCDRAELPLRLEELIAADYAARDGTGQLACLYPLSVVPTGHVVLIAGQRRYAMCAIDALGIPAMLGRPLAVAAVCARCRRPLRLGVRPGAITLAEPPTTVVVARRDASQPAAAVCCPFTVFACGQEHARELVARTPGTHVLSLAEALPDAEALFGDLLRAGALPARRPCWGTIGMDAAEKNAATPSHASLP